VITHNGDDGIQIGGLSSSNTFIENNIDSNLEDGIDIISEGCSHNYFHHNNFINNTDNAKDDGNNIWNDTVLKEGNYWSDYDGIDNDGDDIGDSRYGVDSGNYDYYPLMNSWNGTLPPVKPYVHGPSQGKPNIEYIYTFYSVDPDDDNLYYLIDWGDYTDTDWIGPYDSGEIAEESHIWNAKGSYDIRVKAKDSAGKESEWSDPLIVTMPKNKHYINTPFLKFLEDHLHLFPLIRKLLDI